MIRRLRDYYRQFEELSPEEISAELRERRDAERASALAEVHPLDLATPAWHEPPDAGSAMPGRAASPAPT